MTCKIGNANAVHALGEWGDVVRTDLFGLACLVRKHIPVKLTRIVNGVSLGEALRRIGSVRLAKPPGLARSICCLPSWAVFCLSCRLNSPIRSLTQHRSNQRVRTLAEFFPECRSESRRNDQSTPAMDGGSPSLITRSFHQFDLLMSKLML